ncbi:MAG: BspA family leucine-rich repeat surface protein [Bacilli bacterium]|nr:BspA family leucine-rich repeat surface protein [Bacilli bacterium]
MRNMLSKINSKGFTLTELLAVIVIISILMVLTIPSVLSVMQLVKNKTFITYVEKVSTVARQKALKDTINEEDLESECFIYNLKTDLDLDNVGTFNGYVLINQENDDDKYYITLWNNDYMLIAYNYTDGINYKGERKSIKESLEIYDQSRNKELQVSTLCEYGCGVCVYKSLDEDENYDGESQNVVSDPNKIFGITTLINGPKFNQIIHELAGENECNGWSCKNIKGIKKAESLTSDFEIINISESDEKSQKTPVYMWNDNGILYYYSEAKKIYLNSDSSNMFSNFGNDIGEDITEFFKLVDSSKLTNMNRMFYYALIDNLDLSSLNTSKVTNMGELFYYCMNLSHLDISSFDTSNVTNMSYMFYNCYDLKINIENFNTSKVENMSGMFCGCEGLYRFDLSNFDTSRVTSMSSMFANCRFMITLNISTFDTSNVEDMQGMFSYCENLKTLDVSHFNTSKVKNMRSMFNACSKITELDVSHFDTSNVTSMGWMFINCKCVKSLDVSHFNTSKVTNMFAMFSKCFGLTYLDLSSFDTSKVTDMSYMFDGDNLLSKIEIKVFDTSKVTQSYYMFKECYKLPNYNSNYIKVNKAYAGDGGYFTLKA